MIHHDSLQSADVHQPSSTSSPTSLASVLSATSYPIPEPCTSQSDTTQEAETCLYGGIMLSSRRQSEADSENHSLDDSPIYEKATTSLDLNTSQEHQTNAKPTPPARVRRGRPRKIAKDQSGGDPEQVLPPPDFCNYYRSDSSNSNAASRIAWLNGLTDTARQQAFQPSRPEYYN